MTPEQEKEIVELRDRNLSPKQIARKLGLRPAQVTAFLRDRAQSAERSLIEKEGHLPVFSCLVNESAAVDLLDPANPASEEENAERFGGMASVSVTRREHNKYWIACYLVDYYCLGVKDAVPPMKLSLQDYERFIQKAYEPFFNNYREITLAQARGIVWGAIDYAKQLGFQPHRDFQKAKSHLGEPQEDDPKLTFGRNGKPFYASGPYDDTEKIVKTLQRSIGDGNFNFMMGL